MNISVISPIHGQAGNTTSALMIAHALALTQKKNICLTHINFEDSSLAHFLGGESESDVSTSLTHVVKMLKNDSLPMDELPNYAIKVFPGLDLYTTNKVVLDKQELLSFYEFLLTHMTVYNHVIIDIDSGISSDISKLVIGISDVVIIPVTHNVLLFDKAKKLEESILKSVANARRRRGMRIFFLLNHYNPKISTYRQIARQLGIKPSQLMTLHENSGFIRVCNNGKISDTFASALRGNSQLIKLKSDLKLICKILLKKEFVWEIKQGGESTDV